MRENKDFERGFHGSGLLRGFAVNHQEPVRVRKSHGFSHTATSSGHIVRVPRFSAAIDTPPRTPARLELW
jgi:hypothetical protein